MSATNALTLQAINRVRLFIAAQAREFDAEIAEIGDFIRELNECCLDRGVYFSLKRNGDSSSLKDCSLAFFILGAGTDSGNDRIRELYQAARDSYGKTGKPRIVEYIKIRPGQPQDEAELLREQLGADIEDFHNNYTHIDTVKLGILMQIKQLDIKGLDIRLEGGKALQGSTVLMSLDNVESLTGYENLQNLKQKQAELEDRFYAAMARYKEDPDDAAAYDEYRAVSTERNMAIQQIRSIETQLYHMLEGMYEQTAQGKLSKRQTESYKLVERGLLSEARDVLDFYSIVSESRHDEEIAQQAVKRAEVHVNELMQLNDINAALFDWAAVDECYKEAVRLEEKHNLIRTVTHQYIVYLVRQRRSREGIEIAEKLLSYYQRVGSLKDPDGIARVKSNLGLLYSEARRFVEAENMLTSAIEYCKNNSDIDPHFSSRHLASAHSSLGGIYLATGRLEESIDLQKNSVDIFKEINQQPGRTAQTLHDLGISFLNLANTYNNVLMFDESIKTLTEAVALIEDMLRDDPENIMLKFMFFFCHGLFGAAYLGMLRYDEADAEYTIALEMAIALADVNPEAYESRLAECYRAYGQMLLEAKRYSEAEDKLKLSLQMYKRLADGKPDFYVEFWALAYQGLADLYKETKKYIEAEEALSAALRIYDKYKESDTTFIEKAKEVQKKLDNLSKSQLPEAAVAQFTPEEQDVAMLLTDGLSLREIVRKLGISTVEYSRRVSAIREKVSGIAGADPVVDAVVDEYKLTRREADVLRYLRQGAGNDMITAELYLSEETVRAHVRNVLKKLLIENRQDVAKWLDNYANTD